MQQGIGKNSAINGIAGEYFTLFDISLNGYQCFQIPGNLHFDIGLMYKEFTYRVQVKTSSFKKTSTSYQFFLARRKREHIGNSKVYFKTEDYNGFDFEIFALVILPLKNILYIPSYKLSSKRYISYTGEEKFTLNDCLNKVEKFLQ